MADRTVFGWRKVAVILASERDAELLTALRIPVPIGPTRSWARALLDDVEDFWEVYDVEPDRGAAARQIERKLRALAGEGTMAGLVDACEIFSRSVDDRHNLSLWGHLLDELTMREDELIVLPAAGLADRVSVGLRAAGWPRTDHIQGRQPEHIGDRWEFSFWRATGVDADVLADEVLETRFIERVLTHLAQTLTPAERAALVVWVNAEDEARQAEPRPSIWPLRKPLTLDAVR